MPGSTPNFGIPYPCAGETINPSVFENFAEAVEAGIASVEADAALALTRPNAAVRFNGTSTAAGVVTVLNMSFADFQNGVSIPGADNFVVSAGIYMVTLDAGSTTFSTTVTSWAAEIRQNTIVRYRRKVSPDPAVLVAGFLNVAGLLHCANSDSIDFTWQWTGAGINLVVPARATICKISDL